MQATVQRQNTVYMNRRLRSGRSGLWFLLLAGALLSGCRAGIPCPDPPEGAKFSTPTEQSENVQLGSSDPVKLDRKGHVKKKKYKNLKANRKKASYWRNPFAK